MTNLEGQPSSEHPSSRPRPVTVALWLIIATYVVGVVTLVARQITGSPSVGTHQPSRWLTFAVLLVVYALVGGLIAALAFRRRWAWWVWLVLFVLGLPALWSGLHRSLDQGAFSATRYAVLTALDVAAVVLLLLRSSRQWYGVGRKRGEPNPWRWSDSPKEP